MKRFALSVILISACSLAGCDNKTPPANPPATGNGIQVQTPGADVKADKNGVEVKAPNTNVEIKK